MNNEIRPFSLKNTKSLIEVVLPVQKISAEAYKEQMAGAGKTLAPLGSYWKGRKPLILNRACLLASLLPATDKPSIDLKVFELLMGMDEHSLKKRLKLSDSDSLPKSSYRAIISDGLRPEELGDSLHEHIWNTVNKHLKTSAKSIPELVEQLGIMRFGHRPKFTDTFSGSGQIPFEAARIGFEVVASDLNPIACLLTWGAFNIVGGSTENLVDVKSQQLETLKKVSKVVEELEIETDGKGSTPKVFLYCVEAICPQTGWMVPLLPSFIISRQRTGEMFNAAVELVPDRLNKRYEIKIKTKLTPAELEVAAKGTIRSDGRGQDPYIIHTVDGKEYKTKISTLREDYTDQSGNTKNKLRKWDQLDFTPNSTDIFQERLYAIQWIHNNTGKYEFREVTAEDLERERKVIKYLKNNISEWQKNGFIPDMKIEAGYNTDQPIRERGWTHWHHLFNPRQLLVAGLFNKYSGAAGKIGLTQVLNYNSKLSIWDVLSGGGGSVKNTFYNQALNTLFTYGCRSFYNLSDLFQKDYASFPLKFKHEIISMPANEIASETDIYVTDPPYGDAVKYEEITEFFIGWFRKNPPKEFVHWNWDSRRSLAIKGEGEEFRKSMVSAYAKMTEVMSDNGLQVIMFTHQSGTIWADMANIVWASGLQVTAAWYIVTETDSALREGSYVKGTVLLVLRKRNANVKTNRDDLAWEIQEEVEQQVKDLTGLNQEVKVSSRDENLFEDADIQMAGYAAALRVLTKYTIIDGREMQKEAVRPRVKGEKTFVDELIEFAVATANKTLVPSGIDKVYWDKLSSAERFILKMIDLETRGVKALDNYQNFAKAFKVKDFTPFMANKKANVARLKSAVEFGKLEMNDGSELFQSVVRAVFYAIMELVKDVDSNSVIQHLSFNVKDYYNSSQRDLIIAIAEYLTSKLEAVRPEEASASRILCELVKNQKLG